MAELKSIKSSVNVTETLLILDSMIGNDAVNIAQNFNSVIDLNGFILSKMDSDTRGGSALSLYYATKKPIKFIGAGEKISDIEDFHPERIASRILDLGDMLSLIEQAEQKFDEKEVEKLEKKLKKNKFDIDDFYKQLQQIKKLGSMDKLISMLPGGAAVSSQLNNVDTGAELDKTEAIINSMTKKEKSNPKVMNASRRKRVAIGSGTSVTDVNKFLKSFDRMKKMIKTLPKGNLNGIGKMIGLS